MDSYGSYGKKYPIWTLLPCEKSAQKATAPFFPAKKHVVTVIKRSAPSFGKKQINAQLMRDALRVARVEEFQVGPKKMAWKVQREAEAAFGCGSKWKT